MQIPALPALDWTNGALDASFDSRAGELTLHAAAGSDWTNDALGGPAQHRASMLGFQVEGDFTLSARVRVVGERTTFDAAVLGLWCDEQHWAKLCFEYSPDGRAMIVSVVTNDFSDDCNSSVVEQGFTHLRIARIGDAFAFHASDDGERWEFVRVFRMNSDLPVTVGFMSQAPMGEDCDSRFTRIRFSAGAPADLRDGS
ncbi:DUF1349 domain-containing protein [Microbacterium sp. NPDC097977]|uniref:DUF1349 domain-containing protein n=1 Tax=Microbacterium sp. NPDC097977 TaxID=3155686 RepID=UPI003318DE6B